MKHSDATQSLVDNPLDLQREVEKLRREIRQKDRLIARKDQELQNYLDTLSHEIKSPIISTRGFAALLTEHYAPLLPEEGRRYLESISKNVDRLEALVGDLLLLSRMHLDHNSFERVNVNALLTDILLSLHGAYEFKLLNFQIQPNMPEAFGYRAGLRHIFTNLIVNALKYRRERVEPRIEIGCAADELFLKFYVRDNGIGIPTTTRNRVFDMFVRAGNTKGVRGSGLGLTIARRIVAAHGGEIWVSSKVGKGSVFCFTLQRAPESVLESSSRHPQVEGSE